MIPSLHIERLAAKDFEPYRSGLIDLLLDAVNHGASVGFLDDIDQQQAGAYVDQVLSGLRDHSLLLWVALDQGRVLGSVQLGLCQKRNGLNRAEVQKLLVHSNARRRGIANSLMHRLEGEAAELQRGLLYLDTEAGSDAESFYLAQGYTCIGGLPDYACGPDGTYRANAIYYKTLSRPQP